jgi:hypothetical protein
MGTDHSGTGPGRRRRRGRVLGAVVAAVAGTAVLAAAVAAFPLVAERSACSAAERRVFAEVPHYGGARPRPSGNGDAGSCMATYRAPVPEAPVLAHYRQALRSRGWTLQVGHAGAGTDVEGRPLRTGELSARRGADRYTVLYESGPSLRGGGTHVAVHVSRD